MANTSVAQVQTVPYDALRSDDTMIALSKAHAAWWLLDEMAYGDLVRSAGSPSPKAAADGLAEVRDWLVKMALDTLHEALEEAESAYRKLRGGAQPEAAA